jgi:hypothetical protein
VAESFSTQIAAELVASFVDPALGKSSNPAFWESHVLAWISDRVQLRFRSIAGVARVIMVRNSAAPPAGQVEDVGELLAQLEPPEPGITAINGVLGLVSVPPLTWTDPSSPHPGRPSRRRGPSQICRIAGTGSAPDLPAGA